MPPFKKGDIGNPAGRPVGSRGKATIAAEALMEGETDRLTRKCIDAARRAIVWPCAFAWNESIQSAKGGH